MFLSDIVKRGVEVALHEAVAVVRDVIERMPDRAVPGLDGVELLPVGRVEVRGGELTDLPVQRLIELFRALVGGGAAPLQLDLALSEPLESADALSQVLAYFERPQRATILQGLYSRAAAASPLASADELTASLRATSTQPADAAQNKAPSILQDRNLYYIAAFLAVAAFTVVTVAVTRRGTHSASTPEATTTLSKVSDSLVEAVGTAVSSIGQRVGLSGNAQPPAANTEVAGPPLEQRSATASADRGTRKNAGTVTADPLDKGDPRAGRQAQRRSVADSSPLVVREERVVEASDPSTEVVYTTGSPNVTPPLAVGPQLPNEPPAGVPLDRLTRIQLVILPDGRVDSVRLVGQPHDVLDSMLLSAAKAWQFRPAMKDGIPVKYRMTMSFLIPRPR